MRGYPEHLVAQYIEKWGNADSIALLDPRFSIFSVPDIEGIIGYRQEAGCAVVIADPLCAPENSGALAQAFYEHAKQQFKSIIYILASEKFTQWALTTIAKSAISIGHELVIDPTIDVLSSNGSSTRKLRNKYNYAQRTGLIFKEYTGDDSVLEAAMEACAQQWLQGRKGIQMYHSEIDMFAYRSNKRWFYVEYQGKIIALAILNRIYAYKGWVLNRLIVLKDTPYGTSEFLVTSVLTTMRSEGCTFFSIGTSPNKALENIYGLNALWRMMVIFGFKVVQKFFDVSGRQRYWEKFKPQKFSSFFVFDTTILSIKHAIAILRALNIGK